MKIKITLILTILVLIAGCSKSFVLVNIPVKYTKAVDFSKYEKVIYADLKTDTKATEYDPKGIIYDFFVNELPVEIDTKIRHRKSDPARKEVLPDSLRMDNPGSLIITGDLILKINKRSIIRKKKMTGGKKIKALVQVEDWHMSLKIVIAEASGGKQVFAKTFTDKIVEANSLRPDFNFKKQFNETTDKFVQNILIKYRPQQRFLLKK